MHVQDSSAGTRGRCPFCKGVIQVPQATVAVSAERANKVLGPSVAAPAAAVFADGPPVNPSNGEETIYSDRDVTVTHARVLCGEITFALKNITSAKMGVTPASPTIAYVLLAVGSVMLAAPIPAILPGGTTVCLVLGALSFAYGFRKWTQATADYHLLLSSSSGEFRAYTSKYQRQIEKIVASVNKAIVRKSVKRSP